jgi:hypothetical protein
VFFRVTAERLQAEMAGTPQTTHALALPTPPQTTSDGTSHAADQQFELQQLQQLANWLAQNSMTAPPQITLRISF